MALFHADDPKLNHALPVMTFDRPLRCQPPGCCCYLQQMKVYEGNGADTGGHPIGWLEQTWSCCGTSFNINVDGVTRYQISGPCCVINGPCCCSDQQEFFIETTAGDRIDTPGGEARITKMGTKGLGDAVREAATDADNFGCTFPPTVTPEAKAVILAAVFLIDFLYFEDSGNDDAASVAFGDD